MKRLSAAACGLAVISLSAIGCSAITPTVVVGPDQQQITLITGGYGYEVGDIVLIDTQKAPALGDIVQYDWGLNKSNAMAMGPGAYLAKIVGLPGDNVSFRQSSYEANGQTIEANMGRMIWGTQKFDDINGMNLMVPEREFLADKFVGYESDYYARFTVKKEAITGIILKKLGHDKEFEKEMKGRVY